MALMTDKKYLEQWREFQENISKATPIDLKETPIEKQKRIANLEKKGNEEKWFKYYFPNFYTSEPAPFHIAATRRVIYNPEWMEVRSWSRELSKSGRTMMEVLYLAMTGKKKNIILVSNNWNDAARLLLPYKSILEKNNRLKNDYGIQESVGGWEAGEFITRKGVAFRAVGAGQSPRGTRNDADRPDVILIDDIDTDEECRNPERIDYKVDWVQEALMGTRSVSNPMLIIICGNIIAKYCTITELGKLADVWEVINIRDASGQSTWPQKNTEAMIDRVLSKLKWSAQQKEYFNNPISKGDIFKELTFGKCPPLKSCDNVVIYADPSTSNKDRGNGKQASYKSVVVVGSKGLKRYVYKVFLEQTGNSNFVDWLFVTYVYIVINGVQSKKVYIENNSLQDPFYEQVILPLVRTKSNAFKVPLPITPDKRKKPDKFERIEGTLEPLNRLGNLIFNEAEEKNPHMVRMKDQMLGVSVKAKIMDGPDALEGACWIIQNTTGRSLEAYSFGAIESRRY